MIAAVRLGEVLLAHGGDFHWYDYLLYLFPLIVLAGMFVVERWRHRSGKRAKTDPRDFTNRPKR